MLLWFSAFCHVYSRIFPDGKGEADKHTNCVDLQIGFKKCSKARGGGVLVQVHPAWYEMASDLVHFLLALIIIRYFSVHYVVNIAQKKMGEGKVPEGKELITVLG